jgi:hypothetical protein
MAILTFIPSEWRFYRLQHLLHHIIRADPVQNSLHSIQGAAPLHTPFILWRSNDDAMGVDLAGGQRNQRRRYVVNIMEGSKYTAMLASDAGKDNGSTHCAKMLKCRVASAEMPPATARCSLMKTMMLWRYARTSELILTSATRFANSVRSCDGQYVVSMVMYSHTAASRTDDGFFFAVVYRCM